MHSTEFYDSVKNTGARQPSSIVSRMRIESRREYFCLVNFQFTSESKTENCKQGPQGPEKTPLFSISSTSSKTPFFRFRVQARENNPFFQNREQNLERSCVHQVNTEWQHREQVTLARVTSQVKSTRVAGRVKSLLLFFQYGVVYSPFVKWQKYFVNCLVISMMKHSWGAIFSGLHFYTLSKTLIACSSDFLKWKRC